MIDPVTVDEMLSDEVEEMTPEEKECYQLNEEYRKGYEKALAEWQAKEPERIAAREERERIESEKRAREELVSPFLPTLKEGWVLDGGDIIRRHNSRGVSGAVIWVDEKYDALNDMDIEVFGVGHDLLSDDDEFFVTTIENAYEAIDALDVAKGLRFKR